MLFLGITVAGAGYKLLSSVLTFSPPTIVQVEPEMYTPPPEDDTLRPPRPDELAVEFLLKTVFPFLSSSRHHRRYVFRARGPQNPHSPYHWLGNPRTFWASPSQSVRGTHVLTGTYAAMTTTKIAPLSELLLWGSLQSYDPAIVLNKDHTFMTTFAYTPPDIAYFSEAEQDAYFAQLHQAMRFAQEDYHLLFDSWCFLLRRIHRSPHTTPPPCLWMRRMPCRSRRQS